MKKYRWAILGTGKIANRFAEALNNIPEEAELLAVGSRRIESAESFADKYSIEKRYVGYEQVVADPDVDIVYIGTPGVCHIKDVTMCLEAGKSVLCEKALTINAKESQALIMLARKKNLFLMEAMWTRFFPIHRKIQELIAEGALGDPRGVLANFSAVAPPGDDNRFWDVELGASALLDIGLYGIAFASQLFGDPEEVTGLAYIGPNGFDYHSSCAMKYKGGRLATIMSSQMTHDIKDAVVFGDKGKIVIDDPWYKPTAMTVHREGKDPERIEYPLDGFNGYEYEAREVMECLDRGETESKMVPLEESLSIIKTLDTLRNQWGFQFPSEK